MREAPAAVEGASFISWGTLYNDIVVIGGLMSVIEKTESQNGWTTWLTLVLLIGIIALLTVALYFNNPSFAPKLDTKITYYAVALTNGLTFYGHPESISKGGVVLTDVYYVVRQVNPQTREVHNSLVSHRKSEWHSPERTIVNTSNIVLMEPVDPASTVAKLIAEQKAQKE
jgi:hypothetical protein